ncbi:MAG: c-type cytochrome [Akkermansiaceae bacterium]|nr:c-type cytochrome [Akkermansiaceae bacterium]
MKLLQVVPEASQALPIVDAFLANEKGPGALAAVLNRAGVSLPPEVALVAMNRASGAATRPEELVKAFQKAGGLRPMKLQLTPAEMEEMMRRVSSKGDPRRGEKVYRRASMQCIVCHAIGGAGGVIGPDLVSIGSSAPVDYLVESLLEPSKKIKEGYHTALVTTRAGDNFAGAVAREDEREIVIRDAAGKETRIPKGEVASTTISPVSLMPVGLTASLREDEFVDLVRFLSELGKEGAFKTPPNRLVRHWQALQPHQRTRDAVGHYGTRVFAEEFPTYQWIPIVAMVNGGLPADELPQVRGRGKNRYGVGRFFLEAAQPAKVPVKINGRLRDLDLFLGEQEIKLSEGTATTVTLDLKAGRNKVTLAGLLGRGFDAVSVELLGDAGAAEVVTHAELK